MKSNEGRARKEPDEFFNYLAYNGIKN